MLRLVRGLSSSSVISSAGAGKMNTCQFHPDQEGILVLDHKL